MKRAFLAKCLSFALLGVPLLLLGGPAFAASTEVDDVLRTMVNTSSSIPGALTGLAYILGLIIAVTGVLKLKEHVLNPQQAPLRTPLVRFLAAGALFALPMISQAVKNAFDGGTTSVFNPYSSFASMFGGLIGTITTFTSFGLDFNAVLNSIINSFEDAPGFISAGTYLMALILLISGILKVKEHVENPEQTGMREGVVRLLVAGALLALPTIYQATFSLIGVPSLLGGLGSLFSALTMFFSGYSGGMCNPTGFMTGGKLGAAICGVVAHTAGLHAFLAGIGYMLGLVLAVWGIFKIKAHVLNPSQTPLHEGVTRFVAAGLFFALPALITVARNTLTTLPMVAAGASPVTTFNETPMACTGTGGLDAVLYCMMDDVFGPLHVVLNFFSIIIGTILIMVGISRLMKSAQEGPKGPGGMGTLFTFLAGSALISYNALMRAASSTFGMTFLGASKTNAVMQYTKGMSAPEIAATHTTISAILKFMIIVGLISFVRGIYIIRNAAEGNQQSSVMAGVTHMVGGALAVNLGGLINAVQSTLGLTSYGIVFS